jgi:hypothetical protein
MSEPDEAMVEAVARAINAADNEWADAPRTTPHEVWPTHVARAVLSVPVVRDALARDAQVAEWVRQGADGGVMQNVLPIHHLYAPSPGDRDDSEEQR